MPIIERAIELAAEWHDQTYRKGRWRPPAFETPADLQVPTMAHVTCVAATVARAGWPDTIIAAAYLHDALEDRNAQKAMLDERVIEEEVGVAVTELVLTVSENASQEVSKRSDWRTRKQAYLSQIIDGKAGAVAISLADKIHNLWTINQNIEAGIDPFETTDTRKGLSAGPESQLWFHTEVLQASREFDDLRLQAMRSQLYEEITRFELLVGVTYE